MNGTQQSQFLRNIHQSFIAYQRKEQNWCPNEFVETIYMAGDSECVSHGVEELEGVIESAMRFTLRCLANPDCEGSREVLDAIEEVRRGRQG